MSQNLSQNQLILDILKDTKEDLASIRQTNQDVLDQLNGVNGQLQLLRNDFENEQEHARRAFQNILDIQNKLENDNRAMENRVIALEKDLESAKKDIEGIEDLKKQIRNSFIGVLAVAILGVIGVNIK